MIYFKGFFYQKIYQKTLIGIQKDITREILNLEIEEIIIAFDKQFQNIGDEEWKGWTKKLKDIDRKYSSRVKISFMFDIIIFEKFSF